MENPLRILRLAAIPLRLASFLTIVVLSGALAIANTVAPFGWPLMLILLGWFFRYSFEFLDNMIGGAREAPVLSVEMVFGSIGEWRSLLPLTIAVAVFFASGATSYWFGVAVTGVAGLTAVAAFPAVLAIQGWTGKTRQALSPAHCARMARLLGRDYLWIAGFTALIVTCCVIVLYAQTPAMLRIAVLLYAWLAVIALSGGTVYFRRQSIEEQTEFLDKREVVESPAEVARRREEIVDSVYASWRAGAQENAWQTLSRHITTSEDPLAELRIVYRRASNWEGTRFADRVAQELLSRLLAEDREGEALMLARERLEQDASFRPREDSELSRLVQIANANADRATARALVETPSK